MTPSGVPPMPHSRSRACAVDREQRAGDVAVGDQAHARAGVADGLDALLVARAVEHDDHHVAHVGALALGDELDGLAERAVEVEQVGDVVAAGHLLHVDASGPGRTSRRARRARSRRARWACPRAHSVRALERVDGDVDRGEQPSPICSPLESIGASSFSPSPITTMPSMWIVCSTACMPSTAAWSAASLSPMPTQRAGGERRGLGDAHELEREVAVRDFARGHRTVTPGGLRGVRWSTRGTEPPTVMRIVPRSAIHQPMPSADLARRLAGPVDDAVVDDEAERDDPDDRGHLAARPRQLVVADDDVEQDDRRERRGEEQIAQDRVRVPARRRRPSSRRRSRSRLSGSRLVPGKEHAEREEQPAHRRDDLRAA